MSALEIVVIVCCVLFFVGVVTATVVKKTRDRKKGIHTCCGCDGCCSGCCNCHKDLPDDIKKIVEKHRTSA